MTKIITLIVLFVVSAVTAQGNFEKGMGDALTTWKNGNSKVLTSKVRNFHLTAFALSGPMRSYRDEAPKSKTTKMAFKEHWFVPFHTDI